MANPIPYKIKKGDTLESIASEKKIKNPNDLKAYHNNNCPLNEQIGPDLKEGNILYVPSQEEIDEMNGASKEKNQPEPEKKPEDKKDEEKPEEEEKKEESKGPHEGKYYVVHGATCVCDKAEDPTKEAELQVTTHQKMIYNDQAKKWAATEEDKQFNPPAATFGKCKLKPSSGGYQPCALAPAPKWDKPYDKTKVMGKCVLTQISELKCTVGGKITIKKHGQTDTATAAHAENTNPAEMGHANPGVKKPPVKIDYPSVDYISITAVENRSAFETVKSKAGKIVEQVLVRPDENCTFTANVVKGNKALASWVIYDGFEGKKDKKILTKEQIGPEFTNSFPTIGKYRVEGYGKPKTKEFEKGKYDNNDPDCSLDIEVAYNKLDGSELKPLKGDLFTRVASKVNKLREGFPATFEAKFLMEPNAQELERLTMYVTDASGNVLEDGQKSGNSITFTPQNTGAVYNFIAEYIDEAGVVQKQTFKGETEANSVAAISHNKEIIRPGTPLSFSVAKTRYNFVVDTKDDLTPNEIQDIKWNLNGKSIGTGRSVSIPGSELTETGDYVVEAYAKISNSWGSAAKDEDDDWRFKVKENDVVNITVEGSPKVGKTIKLKVGKTIFADIKPEEKVNWNITGGPSYNDKKEVSIVLNKPGILPVKSFINSLSGVTENIDVKQAQVTNTQFANSSGMMVEKASYGHKLRVVVTHKELQGESFILALWKDDQTQLNNLLRTIEIKNYDGNPIDLILDHDIKTKAGGKEFKLSASVQSSHLKVLGEKTVHQRLLVTDKREIYRAIIGSEDGKEKHSVSNYESVSWFYAQTTGFSPKEELFLEIREAVSWAKDPVLIHSAGIKVDESGIIKHKLNWADIKNKKQSQLVYAILKEKNAEGEILYDADGRLTYAATSIMKTGMPQSNSGYSSAAIVGSSQLSQNTNGSSCYCKVNNLVWGEKFNCQERKKVIQICKNLWPSKNEVVMANHLMVCMAIETGGEFLPSTGYKSGGATGLVQWTGTALEGMNKNNKYNKGSELTKKKLAEMTVLEQLDYVELYFKMWIDSGKIINDSLDMYMCIWCPAAVGKEEGFVCYTKAKDEEIKKNNPNTKYQPYTSNSGIDGEYYDEKSQELLKGAKDGEITKGELKPRLRLKAVEGESFRVKFYNCGGKDNNVPLEIADIITYKVFSDGNIEKHIPKKIREDVKDKYKYVYVDKNKKEHNICIVDFFETDKRENGVKIESIPSGYKSTYKYPKGGNAQTAYVYENGDICVEGSKYGYRKYPKGQGKVQLVRMKDSLAYESGEVKVFYTFAGSQRRYCSPEAYAGFIGALVMIDRKDVRSTGMCFADATSYPSVSHPNGDSADTMYFGTLAEEQLKVNAFRFYHFEHIHRGSSGWYPQLTGTTYSSGHEDHLHSGDFISSKLKVIND